MSFRSRARESRKAGRLLPLGVLHLLIQAVLLVACEKSHPTERRYEITGALESRIERSNAILEKHCAIPGPLVDAHLAEDLFNNGTGLVPGPSDSNLFGVIAIKQEDLEKWREALGPAQDPPTDLSSYVPSPPPEWWPKISDFTDSEFHNPATLTGRSHGVLLLSPSRRLIVFSAM